MRRGGTRSIERIWTSVAAALSAGLAGGCALPAQRADFRSVDPQERSLATVQARDLRDVPGLIEELGSDDPAARMLANQALERVTGQSMAFDYAAPERKRAEAIDRWKEWARGVQQGPGSGSPTPGGAPTASSR